MKAVCCARSKPAGCISTLCKIAAHGVQARCALLTPFGQGASHRRKVRNAFVLCLARPRKFCSSIEVQHGGLHHFFEAQMPRNPTAQSKALALQKNVNLL